MKIEFDGDSLAIPIKNSDNLVGVLKIGKTRDGYLHHFVWDNGSDIKLLPQPIGDYSEKTTGAGFSWLLKVYGRAVGVKPDSKEFRKQVWKPLIENLQGSEAYHRFKEEAVKAEVSCLREMIEKIVIYKRGLRSESVPVELVVNLFDRREVLSLNANDIRKLDKVQEAFLKTFGYIPPELVRIKSEEWILEVLNWLHSEKRAEFKELEITQENIVVDEVLAYIQGLEVTGDKNDLSFRTAAYYDGEALVVLNSTIFEVVKKTGLNLSPEKIKVILEPYLLKNSKAIWVGKKTRKAWFFDPEKLGLSHKELLERIHGDNDES
jgi:hypothetical protein